MFYVLRGSGTVRASGGAGPGDDSVDLSWAQGDLFTLPAFTRVSLSAGGVGAALYYVHDGPLLDYLGVAPS